MRFKKIHSYYGIRYLLGVLKESHLLSFLVAFFIFSTFFMYPLFSKAGVFRNSYMSFHLPKNWKCQRRGTEWICYESNKKPPYEAIVVMTAKEKNPSIDNFKRYKSYLKSPRKIPTKKGQKMSKVKHVREIYLSQQPWVDGMHLHGEVFSYYTRYLVTIYKRLVILISFSVQEESYMKYSKVFSQMMKGMRVIASDNLMKQRIQSDIRSSQKGLPIGGGSSLPLAGDDFGDEELSSSDFPSSSENNNLLFFLVSLVSVGVVAYYLFSRRKRN